jgi:hypothetical protein
MFCERLQGFQSTRKSALLQVAYSSQNTSWRFKKRKIFGIYETNI